jgi:hypothetical protein
MNISSIVRRALHESRARAMEDLADSVDRDQRDMITGIVEILRQVDDEGNRRRIVAGLTRKLRGEGIKLDGELFAQACGTSLKRDNS